MARVDRFEDLIAWQKARGLVREIYRTIRSPAFSKDRVLASQISRAATSILSNIAEGFERGGRTEFHRFLVIAKASCAEVRSQLYIALDVGYVQKTEFERLSAMAAEVARIIGGLRASVEPKAKKAH